MKNEKHETEIFKILEMKSVLFCQFYVCRLTCFKNIKTNFKKKKMFQVEVCGYVPWILEKVILCFQHFFFYSFIKIVI